MIGATQKSHSCAMAHCNYVFVGIPGSGRGAGHEAFRRAGSCDTGDLNWHHSESWLDKPAPMASLIANAGVGTTVGLYHYDGEAFRFMYSEPEASDNSIRTIFEDRAGRISPW